MGKLTGYKVWLIFDGRGWVDPDKAMVYEAFNQPGDTLEEVMKARDEDWPDGVVYEYDEQEPDVEGENKLLVNQRLIG